MVFMRYNNRLPKYINHSTINFENYKLIQCFKLLHTIWEDKRMRENSNELSNCGVPIAIKGVAVYSGI